MAKSSPTAGLESVKFACDMPEPYGMPTTLDF